MRTPRTALFVTMLAALLVPVGAGTQTRDAAAAKTRGTAVIAGTVVSDDADPKPVRRVRVTCSSPDDVFSRGATAITDDAGRFVFTGLRAGTLHDRGDQGRLGADVIRRQAAATSRLSDPADGGTEGRDRRQDVARQRHHRRGARSCQPAVREYVVNALRYAMQNGERRLVSTGISGTTDDRGVYRIWGLAPGDYLVGAAGRASGVGGPSSELRLAGERGAATAP